ncbi:hypothetical protein [Streptomyces resistomycificus]|uniref:Uncharacterized protein n=1 Tax=Streptomyces resistomycificus TaxID=67356 RepID=A0A0L8L5D1_9ACTN|nr:hypothetical protein [Streptomyces resistomycificus]KOG33330.1 hypothetical protein ADK37_23430 [Streptomyces resistomycificus]KUN99540.1 hypothetical protein AQJ84_11370 [Streptomyces resistomycificus]
MIGETTEYRMVVHGEQRYTVPDAIQAAPGLVVFRMPNDQSINCPARWRIGHHDGRAIAEAMRREDAFKGVAILVESGIDWTRDEDYLQVTISSKTARDLYAKLSYAWCDEPGSSYMPGDVTHNGTYTDADIEATAAEFKADGYNALDVMVAMTHRVPWMGLDTDDFNEAHNRVVELADAD